MSLQDELLFYHGSPMRFEVLVPSKPKCPFNRVTDGLFGLYATPDREEAIAMGARKMIIGEFRTFLHPTEKRIIVVSGTIPQDGRVYLHVVTPELFEPSGKPGQWISRVNVTPIRIEEILDIGRYVRYANETEKNLYWKKLVVDNFIRY